MKNKILASLNDPYKINELAPNGFTFLIAADVFSNSNIYGQRKENFIRNQASHINTHNSDYTSSAAVSIELTDGAVPFNDSLSDAIFLRHSNKKYIKKSSTMDSLSFLLKLSCGVKDDNGLDAKRMFPSGGALYTSRVYVDVRNIENVSPGLYLFNPIRNTLDLINDQITDQLRSELQYDSESLDSIQNASFQIFFSIKPQLTVMKYGEHGLKIALIELGHACQNIWLVATACGFSAHVNSALSLKISETFLRTDGEGEFLLYSCIIGYAE